MGVSSSLWLPVWRSGTVQDGRSRLGEAIRSARPSMSTADRAGRLAQRICRSCYYSSWPADYKHSPVIALRYGLCLALPERRNCPYNRDDEQHPEREACEQSARMIVAAAALLAAVLDWSSDVCGGASAGRVARASGWRARRREAIRKRGGRFLIYPGGRLRAALDWSPIRSFTSMVVVSIHEQLRRLFRVLVGDALRLSGSLRSISESAVRLGVSWQSPEIVLPRPGVQVVLQRPGMARVLVDNFETLEPSRWSKTGNVSLVDEPHASERKSLRIPSGGASLTHKLDEAAHGWPARARVSRRRVGHSRSEVVDRSDIPEPDRSVARARFPGLDRRESGGRIALSGPALTIQRLARTPGWHRLIFRFAPENTEISVDGKDLAHGKGPDGPLISVRLASLPPAADAPVPDPSKTPACHIDDLQLTRFTELPATFRARHLAR